MTTIIASLFGRQRDDYGDQVCVKYDNYLILFLINLFRGLRYVSFSLRSNNVWSPLNSRLRVDILFVLLWLWRLRINDRCFIAWICNGKNPSICNKFVDLTYDYAQVNGQLKVQGLTKTLSTPFRCSIACTNISEHLFILCAVTWNKGF